MQILTRTRRCVRMAKMQGAEASLGNNGRNHPNKLACFGWLQIKHAVFDCKVHKQKPHVKVGLFRMVTQWAGLVKKERV